MGTIGERLKKIRKEKSLSQKALADLLSTSSGYISEIEQNKTIPGGKFLNSLNRALMVSIDWLLTGEGEPYLSTKVKEAQTAPECQPNHSELSDAEIIEQFSDKKYARDLNLHLVELERLNSEAFKKLNPYIKGLLDGLRMKPTECCKYTGPDRRIAERRVKDSPGKFKGAKDRRSGKDRRVAVLG